MSILLLLLFLFVTECGLSLFKTLFYCGKNMQHEIYFLKILSIQYGISDAI